MTRSSPRISLLLSQAGTIGHSHLKSEDFQIQTMVYGYPSATLATAMSHKYMHPELPVAGHRQTHECLLMQMVRSGSPNFLILATLKLIPQSCQTGVQQRSMMCKPATKSSRVSRAMSSCGNLSFIVFVVSSTSVQLLDVAF